jgi:hypothetical protein
VRALHLLIAIAIALLVSVAVGCGAKDVSSDEVELKLQAQIEGVSNPSCEEQDATGMDAYGVHQMFVCSAQYFGQDVGIVVNNSGTDLVALVGAGNKLIKTANLK